MAFDPLVSETFAGSTIGQYLLFFGILTVGAWSSSPTTLRRGPGGGTG
jgi:hypothetical protein